MEKNVNSGKQINGTISEITISHETSSNSRDSHVNIPSSKSTENEIKVDRKQIVSDSDKINEKQIYSFHCFIKEFQKAGHNRLTPWNNQRERFVRDSANKKRIILKEINQFDFDVK